LIAGTVSTEVKAELAHAHGCNHTILQTNIDFVAEVPRISGDEKLPVVFDSVGKDTFLRSLHHSDHLTQYPQELAMSKTAITSPELAPPVGPFSQAIEVGGFLYVSGHVGQDPATGKVVEGGIVAETERVFRNLSAVLKTVGRNFDDVARAGVYLTSMSDFGAMNGIYAKHFSQPFPARTTIAVAALPLGACVEIDLVVKA
jgi:2-iminobutanoate/2-iminopropanoate deaminase